MRRWMNKIEDRETKERVKKYIDAFENHKYNRGGEENSLYSPSTTEDLF